MRHKSPVSWLLSIALLSFISLTHAQEGNELVSSFSQYQSSTSTDVDSSLLDSFFKEQDKDLSGPINSHAKSSPFVHSVTFDNNNIKVKIDITGHSYIYCSSLNIVVDPKEITYSKPTLPKATFHDDALGTSKVFFKELSFTIPITSAVANSLMIIHYQGCDEAGICYPPQSIEVTIPQEISNSQTITSRNEGFTPLDESELQETQHSTESKISSDDDDDELSQTDLVDFFTQGKGTNSDTISQMLSENLLLGLLICFLLGIGLDLTPCVLPMLPIFSAMIVGSKKSSLKVVDVLEQDRSKAKVEASTKVRRINFVFFQNLGFALGLSLTYTILGLLFALAGAQLHGILQSSALNFILAFLMIICALACANIFELKVPSFITNRLQRGTSLLNTSSFPGAFLLGASAAIIASPCTSAPLAGALLYVMKNGDMLMGALVFFTIGMGMAMPLFAIGMFGSRILHKSGIIGDIIKRLMVVVLLATAYIIVRHNLGRAELFVGSLLVYIISVYTMVSIVFFIRRRALPILIATSIALLGLVPTYYALPYFENNQSHHDYIEFYNAQDVTSFDHITYDQHAFVVFTADWCSNCKIMEKEIYSTEHFLNSSMGIKKVVVNITDPKDPDIARLIERFEVIGVPFFITLDKNGSVLEKKLGLVDAKQIFEALDQLRGHKDF